MSNELNLDGYVVSKTVKGAVLNRAGQFWYVAGAVFETFGTGGRALSDYQITMTETDVGASGSYRGDFPACDAGYYKRLYYDTAITSQAIARDAGYDFQWDGSAEVVDGGVGDYEVTVTIRTIGGTAVPGCRVWLSTDNDRENLTAGPQTTNDAGLVTFNCDYATKYYVHCHLSGYQFASANFTPAAGSVAFVKDIATSVVASGSASNYAGSMLQRMINLVRKLTVEPKVNPLYDDDYLIGRAENVYALALGEKKRQEQDPIVATVEVTVASGVNTYILPTTLGPISAVYYRSQTQDYGFKWFYNRYGSQDMWGKGIWVEGNMLRLQAGHNFIDTPIQVECEPNGSARLHCGTCTLNADGDEATFGAVPYLGTIDRSVNAYAGSTFRLFLVTGSTVTGNVIQEVAISSYAAETRVATLAKALDPIPTSDDGSFFYEIAPQIPISLDSVLAMRIAWEINAITQPKKAPGCLAMYNSNLREIRINAYSAQKQSDGQPETGNYTNPEYAGNVGNGGAIYG
jgi:hypothetical protein